MQNVSQHILIFHNYEKFPKGYAKIFFWKAVTDNVDLEGIWKFICDVREKIR